VTNHTTASHRHKTEIQLDPLVCVNEFSIFLRLAVVSCRLVEAILKYYCI
jgi:hypothetical protein